MLLVHFFKATGVAILELGVDVQLASPFLFLLAEQLTLDETELRLLGLELVLNPVLFSFQLAFLDDVGNIVVSIQFDIFDVSQHRIVLHLSHSQLRVVLVLYLLQQPLIRFSLLVPLLLPLLLQPCLSRFVPLLPPLLQISQSRVDVVQEALPVDFLLCLNYKLVFELDFEGHVRVVLVQVVVEVARV